MGSVFKKTVTRSLPPGAEITTRKGERVACWRDHRGRPKTATVTTGGGGIERIREQSKTYYASYRDGEDALVVVPTKCRDESAARRVLAELERRAERVRSGLLTAAEDRVAEHLTTAIGEHFDAYLASMEARVVVPMHRENTRRHLDKLAADCGFARLGDLRREALERWLTDQARADRSARSRNAHRTALVSFCNWCVAVGRLGSNPFKGVPKANEAADPRRRRRAMTEEELARLLDVALRRPLLDAMTDLPPPVMPLVMLVSRPPRP
jgi:hypothetical protein